jgi:hypothetical protein
MQMKAKGGGSRRKPQVPLGAKGREGTRGNGYQRAARHPHGDIAVAEESHEDVEDGCIVHAPGIQSDIAVAEDHRM